MSNRLAKQLNGSSRALAYRIKCEALSALIMAGYASPNCIQLDGIVGLDLESSPPIRLHAHLHRLSGDAQLQISVDISSIRVTAPLYQFLKEEQ